MKFLRAVCFIFFSVQAVSSLALESFSDLPIDGELTLFSIHGSNTVGAALAPNLVKEYLSQKGVEQIELVNTAVENETVIRGVVPATRTSLSVVIEAHGSGTGFKGLNSGSAQIAAASRPVKNKEVQLLKAKADMRASDSEHIVGIDGLAVIINPQNPVEDLSVNEIAEIFSGGYRDWSELGGKPGPIHVYARDNNSGTWDSFKGMVLGKQKKLIDNAERFESNDELSDRVAGDTGGIGFVGLASVRNANWWRCLMAVPKRCCQIN